MEAIGRLGRYNEKTQSIRADVLISDMQCLLSENTNELVNDCNEGVSILPLAMR